MKWSGIIIVVAVLFSESRGESRHRVVKRGVPVSGGNLDDQNNAAEYARKAGDAAITELNNNENVASRSASSAVGQAVGRDYSNRLATTAQYVAQFTVPVTKEQANGVYNVSFYNHLTVYAN
ncbi:unnamed protein product [Orchesella dallaii]|uniref:Uncharacterized protein n=1 Tax=Orchesella dallaii TaxID=48710 RepID=A0ABP1QM57_9HEXA